VTISIVDFSAGHGHQPHYLRLIAEAWSSRRRPSEDLVGSVTRRFTERHPDLLHRLSSGSGLRLSPFTDEAEAAVARAFASFVVPVRTLIKDIETDAPATILLDVAEREATRHGARLLFLPEMDRCLPAIAAGADAMRPVAGIWLKPRFHYRELGWHGAPPPAFEIAEKFMLVRVLANPALKALFFLDPFAATLAGRVAAGGDKARYLPDPLLEPASIDSGREAARETLGLDSARLVVLFFGEISRRKGIEQLVAALALLPDRILPKLALVVAGPASDADIASVAAAIAMLRGRGCQVLFELAYVSDDRAGLLFAAADLVALAYDRHAGMSGVLLLAARAARPVMAQPDGLVGALVKEHRLGAVLPSTRPPDIASCLSHILAEKRVAGFDAEAATTFAEQHRPEHFQREALKALAD
jgi:glycosyltransferase involved in cell wall biosynthesis